MAIVSVADVKGYMRSETTYDEPMYEEAIAAVTPYMNAMTGRDWTEVTASTVATARVFAPEQGSDVLRIDDAAEITSVVENGVTLTAGTDYVARPSNNYSDGGWRPTKLLVRYAQSWYHDGVKPTVTVTAKWGWSTMPPGSKVAWCVAAKGYLLERDVAFGLAAITESGAAGQREAKAVADFIRQYRSYATWGIA